MSQRNPYPTSQFVFSNAYTFQRYQVLMARQQHMMQTASASIAQEQEATQRASKVRKLNEAAQGWTHQEEEKGCEQVEASIQRSQTITESITKVQQAKTVSQPAMMIRQRSHLPSGIQDSAQAIQIGTIIRQRRSANHFKSPIRLNQKLQGIKEAKRQQESSISYSQPVILEQSLPISQNSAFKQPQTKRRKLNDHETYIEYLHRNSQVLHEEEMREQEIHQSPEVVNNNSLDSSRSPIERQETPHFGEKESNQAPEDQLAMLQQEFDLKIDLDNSLREQEEQTQTLLCNPVDSKLDDQIPNVTEVMQSSHIPQVELNNQMHEMANHQNEIHPLTLQDNQIDVDIAEVQPPEEFEDWCKPTEEVNLSIPDSFGSSENNSQNSSQHQIQVEQEAIQNQDEIHNQISILRKSQVMIQQQINALEESKVKRASFILPGASNDHAPPAPVELTHQVIESMTSQFFNRMIGVQRSLV